MASMRYVRDGSRPPANQRNAPQISSSFSGRVRGRGRSSGRGRGRFAPHSFVRPQTLDNKWVRNSEHGSADEAALALDDVASSKENAEQCKYDDDAMLNPEENIHMEDPALSSQDFERRGKHQLVLKKDDTISQENVNKSSSLPSDQDMPSDEHVEGSATNLSNTELEGIRGKFKEASYLERRGKNKLVLKNNDTTKHLGSLKQKISLDTSEPSTTTTRTMPSFSWSRQPTKQPADTSSEMHEGKSLAKGQNTNDYSEAVRADARKRKRQNQHFDPSAKGSRRICLSTNVPKELSSSGLTADELKTETEHPNNDSLTINSTTIPTKQLTDFAYRDTGQGRGHSKRGGHSRKANMGLVRVQPENPSATPICPTFRRGLPCNNPKCTLRHDVSSEASRPICVFFQRNGMCSKGDSCVFRHVKVRWDAEICPVFERLGYCEDPDCALRHVVVKKSKDGKDKSHST